VAGAPKSQASPPEQRDHGHRLSEAVRGVAKWLVRRFFGSLVALGAVTAAHYGSQKAHPGPGPISEQLTREIEDAAQNGRNLIYNQALDLRGTGSRAHVLVLRPRTDAPFESDELWISG
jgi:hypothetical protein